MSSFTFHSADNRSFWRRVLPALVLSARLKTNRRKYSISISGTISIAIVSSNSNRMKNFKK